MSLIQSEVITFGGRSKLGEGIFYNSINNELYWVDILGNHIFRLSESNLSITQWDISHVGNLSPDYISVHKNILPPPSAHQAIYPSCIIPLSANTMIKHPELSEFPFLVNIQQQLRFWSPVDNIFHSYIIPLPPTDLDDMVDSNMRFNDGKCDPFGNLFIGTMDICNRPKRGDLFKLNSSNLKLEPILGDISISNGLAWLNNKTNYYMFYIDTPEKTVKVYEYKCNITFLYNIDLHHISGSPDGMTIDNLGYLWIAMWDGGKVICINPLADNNIIHEILLPVSRPTNCTFGGSNLNFLYISTAIVDSEEHSGYIHVVDMTKNNLPNRGLPGNLLEF